MGEQPPIPHGQGDPLPQRPEAAEPPTPQEMVAIWAFTHPKQNERVVILGRRDFTPRQTAAHIREGHRFGNDFLQGVSMIAKRDGVSPNKVLQSWIEENLREKGAEPVPAIGSTPGAPSTPGDFGYAVFDRYRVGLKNIDGVANVVINRDLSVITVVPELGTRADLSKLPHHLQTIPVRQIGRTN